MFNKALKKEESWMLKVVDSPQKHEALSQLIKLNDYSQQFLCNANKNGFWKYTHHDKKGNYRFKIFFKKTGKKIGRYL